VSAKIVVKAYRGGSKVSLIGSSGKELLTSSVFKEPRAKGATLRALRGLLGESVVVEDETLAAAKSAASKPVAAAKAANGNPASTKTVTAKTVTKPAAKAASKPAVKAVRAKPGAKPNARRSTRTAKPVAAG
jgi:hypothetical protein